MDLKKMQIVWHLNHEYMFKQMLMYKHYKNTINTYHHKDIMYRIKCIETFS